MRWELADNSALEVDKTRQAPVSKIQKQKEPLMSIIYSCCLRAAAAASGNWTSLHLLTWGYISEYKLVLRVYTFLGKLQCTYSCKKKSSHLKTTLDFPFVALAFQNYSKLESVVVIAVVEVYRIFTGEVRTKATKFTKPHGKSYYLIVEVCFNCSCSLQKGFQCRMTTKVECPSSVRKT